MVQLLFLVLYLFTVGSNETLLTEQKPDNQMEKPLSPQEAEAFLFHHLQFDYLDVVHYKYTDANGNLILEHDDRMINAEYGKMVTDPTELYSVNPKTKEVSKIPLPDDPPKKYSVQQADEIMKKRIKYDPANSFGYVFDDHKKYIYAEFGNSPAKEDEEQDTLIEVAWYSFDPYTGEIASYTPVAPRDL